MKLLQGRSPAAWYREAEHQYVAAHQACGVCRGRYCVFRSEASGRVEYTCSACGFSVCHERRTASYVAAAGDETEAECVAAST